MKYFCSVEAGKRGKEVPAHEAESEGEQSGNQAENPHGFRGEGWETFGHQGVTRPRKGREKGKQISEKKNGGELEVSLGDDQDGSNEPHEGSYDVVGVKGPCFEEERGEEDDEQRPKVIDEIGFHRRCMVQGGEEEKVIAEDTPHADQKDFRRDPPAFQPCEAQATAER